MGKIKEHPVWEVYDLHRDCRLNVKYWSKKLVRVRRINLAMEYLILLTAPGSAVAGLVFWETANGKTVWMILTTLTALIGIGKPLLKLSDKVADIQGIVTHYRSLDNQLKEIGNDIRRENEYSPAMVSTFKSIARQTDRISASEPIEEIDANLQKSCFEQVNIELPDTIFYVPSNQND